MERGALQESLKSRKQPGAAVESCFAHTEVGMRDNFVFIHMGNFDNIFNGIPYIISVEKNNYSCEI